MKKLAKAFFSNEAGATAIEYALVASMLSVFIFSALQVVGTEVVTMYTSIQQALSSS